LVDWAYNVLEAYSKSQDTFRVERSCTLKEFVASRKQVPYLVATLEAALGIQLGKEVEVPWEGCYFEVLENCQEASNHLQKGERSIVEKGLTLNIPTSFCFLLKLCASKGTQTALEKAPLEAIPKLRGGIPAMRLFVDILKASETNCFTRHFSNPCFFE